MHGLSLAPLGMLLGSLYDTLRLHRRVFKLHRWAQAQGQYAIRVDDVGIHARTAVSSSTVHWAAFTRCQETENLFVLSGDGSMGDMCVLPERGVRDAGGVERLRELAGRHVTSDIGRRPGPLTDG